MDLFPHARGRCSRPTPTPTPPSRRSTSSTSTTTCSSRGIRPRRSSIRSSTPSSSCGRRPTSGRPARPRSSGIGGRLARSRCVTSSPATPCPTAGSAATSPRAGACSRRPEVDATSIPLVVTPEGDYLVDPSIGELAARVGLSTTPTTDFYDVVIVGGGPAGLGAAVYAASEGLRTVLVERQATGGQAGQSSRIENYLGFPDGVTGIAAHRPGPAAGPQVRRRDPDHPRCGRARVRASSPSRAVRRRWRGRGPRGAARHRDRLPQARYAGCRRPDRSRRLLRLGGDRGPPASARTSTSSAAPTRPARRRCSCRSARPPGHLLVRADSLEKSMSYYLIRQIDEIPNIEVRCTHRGDRGARRRSPRGAHPVQPRVPARRRRCGPATSSCSSAPHPGRSGSTEWCPGRQGFVLTGPDLLVDGRRPPGWDLDRIRTSSRPARPGVFAAGDVRANSVKRVASAVGEGAMAIQLIHGYLEHR